MDDLYNLNRFVLAQENTYQQALTEVKDGKKRSHWMWFIFPQIDGLGLSAFSKIYSIKSIDEAKSYLNHSVLGSRLNEMTAALLEIEGKTASEIFGSPDDLKLKSCMTLFDSLSADNNIFGKVLGKYFAGDRDKKTLDLLSNANG